MWSRELYDGSRAVVMFNRSETKSEIGFKWSEVGLPRDLKFTVRDLWKKKDLGKYSGAYSDMVPPHGGKNDQTVLMRSASLKILFRSLFLFIALVSLLSFQGCKNSSGAESGVVIYPAPEEEMLSEDYTLEVNGLPVDIYLAKIAELEKSPGLDPESGRCWRPIFFYVF